MEIKDYIYKINRLINSENNYDSYRYIFTEYVEYLENLLVQNPSNIKAICQLAIMYYEDRRDTDICLQLMEDALKKYELSMPKESLMELLNNLAYFYDIEYGDNLKAELTLKRSIEMKSDYPSSYYALAYLIAESNPSLAAEIMKCIPNKENLPIHYKFLYGYILMQNELYEDALKYFEDLTHSNDIEIAERSLYNCAIILSIIGKGKESSIIADKLYIGYKEGKNEEILTFELIYLFFILKDYKRVAGLFGIEKTENIHVDVHIIKMYFYALKKIGLEGDCKIAYINKAQEIKDEINEIKSDSDLTENEKIEYIRAYENDLETLYQNYAKAIMDNAVMKVDDIFCYCKGKKVCYLIDCPRHLQP